MHEKVCMIVGEWGDIIIVCGYVVGVGVPSIMDSVGVHKQNKQLGEEHVVERMHGGRIPYANTAILVLVQMFDGSLQKLQKPPSKHL